MARQRDSKGRYTSSKEAFAKSGTPDQYKSTINAIAINDEMSKTSISRRINQLANEVTTTQYADINRTGYPANNIVFQAADFITTPGAKFKINQSVMWTKHPRPLRITAIHNVVISDIHYELDDDLNGIKYTKIPENELSEFKAKIQPVEEKIKLFDTVIISDDKRQQILEAIEQIKQHDLIFKTWGFEDTIEKGRGVSMLFYGEPGTGKTLMCQGIAELLDKKLMVIATADVESSAPGEAERNIRKHFEEAKKNNSILLFDECDSLIYTRQNMGAIMGAQVNELLSQIEKFDGVTLFTTNRLGTLDEAVNRRLALKLAFDMPSLEERSKIWERMMPSKAPLADDIDWTRLAIIEITGGYIKNAVLRAARMAAVSKVKKITMHHLIKAVAQEAESMEEFLRAREKHDATAGLVSGGVAMQQKSIVDKVMGGLSEH